MGEVVGTAYGRTFGRAIALGCSAFTLAVLAWTLPIPRFQDAYRSRLWPVYYATQLEQDWGLFAPEVADSSVFLHLEIVQADGSTRIVEFPDGEPWIGTYRAYRWSAYEESLLDDEELVDIAMRWALASVDDPDTVVRVDLVLRESDVSQGGSGPFTPTYSRFVIDSLNPKSLERD